MIVKRLRAKRNWSQEQVATFSGLSIRTIQRVESGQSASLETLKSLASVFKVDIIHGIFICIVSTVLPNKLTIGANNT